MEWYHTLLIVISLIIILIFITSYVCFRLTFYSKNKLILDKDEIVIPDDKFYRKFKNVIIDDIKYSRSLEFKEYSIKSFDGLTLYAKYYECIKGAPIEIMFHGYKGNAERDLSTGIKRAFRCNRNVLLVDQRASGKSEGKVITFGINESKDCVKWAEFASKEFGEDVKIILTGVSMGAATVLIASSLDLPKNVVGVIADCGYNKASDIIKKVIKEMKLPASIFYPFERIGARIFGHFKLEETSPYESVKNSKIPTIFLHGDADSLIPCDMSLKLYIACTSKKRLVTINGAEHGVSYLEDPEKYINELNDFFNYL